MSGANPAVVQRILRHADPRVTTEVYGHLLPGYLQTPWLLVHGLFVPLVLLVFVWRRVSIEEKAG